MSGKPKLLVTASTFPRWDGDTEPRFVESLSFELAKTFDVFVLAPHCKGAARDEVLFRDGLKLNVRRFRYVMDRFETLTYDGGMLSRVRRNPLRLILLPLFLVAQYASIRALHKKHRFEAIHAHWIIPQGMVATMFGRFSRGAPPVLVTSHGGDLYALRGRVLAAIKGWVLGGASAITVVSEAMREECGRVGIGLDRITVQSMGVDLESKFTLGDPAPREGLVFVGRLVDKKGVTYLIDAMAILARRYPDVHLSIVGDGPLRASLASQAGERGVSDKITFVGSVHNKEVPNYLRRAKIAVMPSVVAPTGDQEGLGLVAVEALGCGCAVVASDLPAVRDTILDGQTGLMAKPEDGADLADKIARLLDDDLLREKLAQQGRAYAVDRFNWRAVGASYVSIIDKMIRTARPR